MKIIRDKGFTLVEIVVAAGLISGLALVIMQMTRQQAVVQKRSEASFEISSISNTIVQNMLNNDACSNTLIVGEVISDGVELDQIVNRNGNPLFVKDSVYGNRQVKIKSLKLEDVVVSSGGGANQYGELNLVVELEKMNNIIKGNKVIKKKIPLMVELDASDSLVKCYSATENAVSTAVEEACASNGGELIDGSCIKTEVQMSDAYCTNSKNGFTRFNTVSKSLQYCDGTNWKETVGTLDCVKVQQTSYINDNFVNNPTLSAFKGVAKVSCSDGYTMVACGAERMTSMGATSNGSSLSSHSTPFPTDNYINSSGECVAGSSVSLMGVSSGAINNLKTQLGYPSSVSNVKAVGTCCRVKN